MLKRVAHVVVFEADVHGYPRRFVTEDDTFSMSHTAWHIRHITQLG